MTNTISVPRELLERIDETAICDGTEACINDDLFNELIALLEAPAVEVGGLVAEAWLVKEHASEFNDYRSSVRVTMIRARFGTPLCSLPKAQAIIDQQAARIAELEREICYLMGEINGEKHE